MTHLLDDGRIAVVVNGKRWIYCPDCLLPVAEDHVYQHEEGINIYNGECMGVVYSGLWACSSRII